MKRLLLNLMLLLCALVVGSGSVWGTTYKLRKVTSVSAGNKYVFERNSCVLNNTVSSSILQTTNSYSKSGLSGTESYVWTLESATGGFYLKNVSLDNKYLNNTSSTSMSFGTKTSIWKFTFSDGVALIQNTSRSDRYIGETSTGSNGYKAYSDPGYGNDITVYVLDEEVDVTSLTISTAPTKTRYEVGEALDMTGFELDADGSSVTSGYGMAIGGSEIDNGYVLSSQGRKTIEVSYGGKIVNQEISVGAVTGIAITTAPTTTEYDPGDTFDATGMVVTASFSTGELVDPDEWTKAVTGYTISPSTAFVGSETYVTVSYAGQSVNQAITVNATHVTGVTLNKPSTSIVYGNTETLTATVAPVEATDKRVSWSSSNEYVASVDENGVVTANAVGTAVITVTTFDLGRTAICEVTVTANSTKPSSVETVLKESFTKIIGTGSANASNFDNTGWTISGYVYGYSGDGIRMGKDGGSGSVKTPALTQVTSTATLTFIARGWSDTENTISISGTNCTVSPTSFTDLTTTFAEKSVSITATGSNPQITISAAGKPRAIIDDVLIVKPRTTVPVTFSATGYASYCSPFALDLTPTEDYAAYAVSATSGSTVTFTKIPGKVAAQTPFILYNSEKGGETVNLPIIEDDDAGIAPVGTNMLHGTLSPTFVATVDGDYTNFGLSSGNFLKINSGVVNANKAYLSVMTDNLPSSARLEIVFADEANGIADNVRTTWADQRYHDLQGRSVAQPTKGLYIVNGKKVLVK